MPRAAAAPGIRYADNPAQDRAQADVQGLLDTWARAVDAGDTEALVALWQPPAFLLADPDVHAIQSNEEVRQFFGAAHGSTRGSGANAEILDLRWPNERVAVVDARLGREAWTLTLRRNERGALVVRVAVLHGAPTAPGHPHH
jgi:hypothetical protein